MAKVYAATHRNGMRAAIKILHAEHAASEVLRARFLHEGYAANHAGHPGALSIFDDGVTPEGDVFLVMELLEGETVFERCTRGERLSLSSALRVTESILEILVCAHGNGIVHRDIKPDNIFLSRDGDIRLLDFGIARTEMPHGEGATLPGAAIGTPAFMPPEQARGHQEAIDGRSDLWAVGATLFWILTGRAVHEGPTPNEELLAAMTAEARSLSELGHFPESVVALVDRALAFDKESRFDSAVSMLSTVRSARGSEAGLERAQLASEALDPDTKSGPLHWARRVRALGTAAAAAVVLVVSPILTLPNDRPAVPGPTAAALQPAAESGPATRTAQSERSPIGAEPTGWRFIPLAAARDVSPQPRAQANQPLPVASPEPGAKRPNRARVQGPGGRAQPARRQRRAQPEGAAEQRSPLPAKVLAAPPSRLADDPSQRTPYDPLSRRK